MGISEMNLFDGSELVENCTVRTIRDSYHYECWYPATKTLIFGDPSCDGKTHNNCLVHILHNSVTGENSYAWVKSKEEYGKR